jgi:hypothetical protein
MSSKVHSIEKQPVALYIRKFFRTRYNFWLGEGGGPERALQRAEEDVRKAVGVVLDNALEKARKEIRADIAEIVA